MTNPVQTSSNQISVPLAFNISDTNRHESIKRIVFGVAGHKSFKVKIIEKLTQHQAQNNRIRALFFNILDAFIRLLLRTKEDIARSKENSCKKDFNRQPTQLEKYLFVRSCEAQRQMALAAQNKYGEDFCKARLAYLNVKVKEEQSPQLLEAHKTDQEALKKNPESSKIAAIDKLNKAKEEMIVQSQAYAEWNKLDYLLDEVRKIKALENTEEKNQQLKHLLDRCPLSSLTDKTDAKTVESVETALMELVQQHGEAKKTFNEKKIQSLNGIAEKRIKELTRSGKLDAETFKHLARTSDIFGIIKEEVLVKKMTEEITAALKARELPKPVDDENKNPELPGQDAHQESQPQDTKQPNNSSSTELHDKHLELVPTASGFISHNNPSPSQANQLSSSSTLLKEEKPLQAVSQDTTIQPPEEPKKEKSSQNKPEKKESEPGFWDRAIAIGKGLGIIKHEQQNVKEPQVKENPSAAKSSTNQQPSDLVTDSNKKKKNLTIADPKNRQSGLDAKIAEIDKMELDVNKDYAVEIEKTQKELTQIDKQLENKKEGELPTEIIDSRVVLHFRLSKLEELNEQKKKALTRKK